MEKTCSNCVHDGCGKIVCMDCVDMSTMFKEKPNKIESRDVLGSTVERLVMSRIWEMPNKWTFKMKCVKSLLDRVVTGEFADPFAGKYSPALYRNDIEENRNATHQMDALDFLKTFDDDSLDGVLFDPPYSVEQCLRKYTPKFKGTAGRAEYWAKCKDQMKRIIKPGGTAVSFCWDSTGVGKTRGFAIKEILLICHGACHNDTIVTVEENVT